jgi:hypothetical protein
MDAINVHALFLTVVITDTVAVKETEILALTSVLVSSAIPWSASCHEVW